MLGAVGQSSISRVNLDENSNLNKYRFLIGGLLNDLFPTVSKRLYATLNNPQLKDEKVREFLELQKLNIRPLLSASFVFFITRNDSLQKSLKICLSQSETVSKIALPFLDKIAASIPAPLKQSQIVFLAPVIVKCFQIALAKVDPKKKNPILSTLSTGADKAARGLGFLWNLRFSILSIGRSAQPSVTLIIQIATVIFDKKIVPIAEKKIYEFGYRGDIPYGKAVSTLVQLPLLLFWNFSTVFNSALHSGLTNMYDDLFGSSYDLSYLKRLYQGALADSIKHALIHEKIDKYLASRIPLKGNNQSWFS
ncbi:MAG: hypothetical protein KBA81_04470 [Rhabdochlamydiaceae bacterium]|nr:hypothetical protein [Rhabdochlamydiaceae bacterium]